MRILHVIAAPLVPSSGLTVVLKCLSYEQNRLKGIEARVLSLNSKVDMIESNYFDTIEGTTIHEYLNQYSPNMAIFHSFYHIEYVNFAMELEKRRIPFFVEPHGSFGHSAMQKSKLKKFIANNTVFRTLIKKSVGYIYTNKAEKDNSVYHSKKGCIIPNGVIKDIVENAAKKKILTKGEMPIFYFLGRYDINHKGLDYLFDALDILENRRISISLNLYGEGHESQSKYVKERISHYHIVKVQEKGTIYGENKKKALETVNILVLTSRYEGSPMTILDGLCYGNPCLLTPGTNVADEAVENNIGWKVQLDSEAIANGFIMAQEDYIANAKEYEERCQKYVLNNYTWEDMAKLSVVEYKRMLNQ